MTIDIFIRNLKYLAEQEPDTYGRAVDNVLCDFRGDVNRHGNITEAAQQSIAGHCTGSSYEMDRDHLLRIIESHFSFKPASGCEPREKPVEPLRTVVPYDYYVVWHLLGSDVQGEGSLETVLHIGHGAAPLRESVPIDRLCGSTNKVGRATWWSFGDDGPASGRDIVAALALPDVTVNIAKRCGGVVEIQIPVEAMSEPLYKPSSLDGFGPGSKFKPDHTTSPWGWTDGDPDDPQRRGRPELVSRSFGYDEIKDRTLCLTVTIYPF